MTHYSFSTFIVDDQNRQAHDLCSAVASLKDLENRPLVLLGDSGSGKTHLLCSIVEQLRERSPRTALGYVTARNFPNEVRALKSNPAPVTRARHAVLLVDQFDKFSAELLQCLAEVAPLFVGENRHLIIASRIPPKSLGKLPASLRRLVESAQVCPVARGSAAAPDAAAPPEPAAAADSALVNELGRLENEVQVLQAELDAASQESARMSDLLVVLEVDRLALEEARAVLAVREQEVQSLQRALDETRKQREALQAENATLVEEAASGPAKIQALEDQLVQARKEADEANSELNRMALRAQSILQQVELNRIRLAENEEAQFQQVLALQQRASELSAPPAYPGNGSGDPLKMRPWYLAPFLPPTDKLDDGK